MPTYFSLNTEYNKVYPIYLTTTGTYYDETEIIRPDGFSEYQFLLTIEGEGLFRYGSKSIKITPGTLLLIPPDIPHLYYKKSKIWKTHWLAFNGNNVDSFLEAVVPKSIEILNIAITNPIYKQMIEVNSLTLDNYQKNALKISSIIYSIIAEVVGLMQYKNKTGGGKHLTKVDMVITYLDENFKNDTTIEDMAKVVDISPQYLCRLFKAQLGMRPFEYLRQLRINKSKTMMLEYPCKKIEEIAAETGFNNPSYYGAIFKKNEKMTPKEFLKLHKG